MTVSVFTVAADQAVVAIAPASEPAGPELVLRVLVKEGRIAEITALTRQRTDETNPT